MLDILTNSSTPDQAVPFDKLDSQAFASSVDQAIELARKRVEEIENLSAPNFENCLLALELSSKELDQVTSVFFNLYHACTTPEIDEQVGTDL